MTCLSPSELRSFQLSELIEPTIKMTHSTIPSPSEIRAQVEASFKKWKESPLTKAEFRELITDLSTIQDLANDDERTKYVPAEIFDTPDGHPSEQGRELRELLSVIDPDDEYGINPYAVSYNYHRADVDDHDYISDWVLAP